MLKVPMSLSMASVIILSRLDLESQTTHMAGRLSGERASKNGKERERSASPASFRTGVRDRLDPEEYQHAKKELKKAILQYYRYAIHEFVCCRLLTGEFGSSFLELLNNYRVRYSATNVLEHTLMCWLGTQLDWFPQSS